MTTMLLPPEDEREINALLLRYATGIDTRDWPLFRSCFTAGVRADYGAFGTWTDADTLTDSMRLMHSEMGPTLHRISNIVLAPTPEGVRARTYVDAVLMTNSTDNAFTQALGLYEDELLHTPEGWRIDKRRFVPIRLSTG